MKIERRNGARERKVLIGMITDKIVLGRISSKWKEGLFPSKWGNLIASWCVDYFSRYNKAPGKMIEALFEGWAEDNRDRDTVGIIERFLEALSGEYATLSEESNTEYVIDQAGALFDATKKAKLAENIQSAIASGNPEKVDKYISSYTKIDLGVGAGIDLLNDKEVLKQAAASKDKDPLIVYPGAIGEFFADALERDGFIALQAPEKTGKTFWLLDIAWRGIQQGRRVAFFQVGDMSQNQIVSRFMARAAGRPWKPCKIKIPTYITPPTTDKGIAERDTKDMKFLHPLPWQKAWEGFQKVANLYYGEKLLHLSVHPNSSISVHGVSSILRTWEREGWIPDVIVIDYADILAPINGMAETRDQVNATWKALRSMSQVNHCLVVTATQAKATSYDKKTMDKRDFSEDKRKHAHVTGMLGINQTEDEKLEELCRLNWIDLRESEFHVSKCVYVAGCLSIANPAIKSTF